MDGREESQKPRASQKTNAVRMGTRKPQGHNACSERKSFPRRSEFTTPAGPVLQRLKPPDFSTLQSWLKPRPTKVLEWRTDFVLDAAFSRLVSGGGRRSLFGVGRIGIAGR
jgi:hypothetical protein